MFNKNILSDMCSITKSIYNGERKLRWLYRGEPRYIDGKYDSGWEITSEFDDEEYMSNPDNVLLITLEELINLEPKAELVIEMPFETEIMYDYENDVLINTANNEKIVEPYKPLLYRAFEKNIDILSDIPKDVEMIEELFNKEKFEITEEYYLNFNTGKLVLADPFYYVEHVECMDIMEESFDIGKYSVTISSKEKIGLGKRVYGVKLNISKENAVKYIELKPEGKEWQVVGIDSGLCAISDKLSQEEFKAFYENWCSKNKGKNFYDSYLCKLFDENSDIGVWKSQETNNNVLIVSSGFGDGIYNPLCGYDSYGKLVNVVIIFIAPEISDME